MHKSMRTIATVLGIVLVVAGIIAALWIGVVRSKDRAFLATLEGHIVFVRRDDGIRNIYRMPAGGGTPVLLFHNEDRAASNRNALFPRWSDNGKTVRFIASTAENTKEGFWKVMEVREDGSDVRIIRDASDTDFVSTLSRSSDIDVKEGSVYAGSGATRKKIYTFHAYDSKFNSGASGASWSPDHRFVIFESCSFIRACGIYIADAAGENLVRLTSGNEPDWTMENLR